MKLNRIGNKLGLAGAVGVLLSIAMVTNQMVTESSVDAANQLADRQQGVADHTLATDITLRRMQIGLRDVRLARTPAEIDKGADLFRKTMVQQQKEIEAALVLVMKPESRERLQKIKSMMSDYFASGEDMIKAQSNLLALVDKRTAISGEWNKAFEATLATPSSSETIPTITEQSPTSGRSGRRCGTTGSPRGRPARSFTSSPSTRPRTSGGS